MREIGCNLRRPDPARHHTTQMGSSPGLGRATHFLVIITSLTLATSITHSNAAKLPTRVQSAINKQINSCEESVEFKKGFLTRRDINGDGVPDYILNYEHFTCGGALNCGSAGCEMEVFASLPDGNFTRVLEGHVRDVKFKSVRGRPAMWVDLHGTFCGKTGADPCSEIRYWNGKTFAPERRTLYSRRH